jgi:hypothetical protein
LTGRMLAVRVELWIGPSEPWLGDFTRRLASHRISPSASREN